VFCMDTDQRRRRYSLDFQSTASFPSRTSRVRFPSTAPIFSIGYGYSPLSEQPLNGVRAGYAVGQQSASEQAGARAIVTPIETI